MSHIRANWLSDDVYPHNDTEYIHERKANESDNEGKNDGGQCNLDGEHFFSHFFSTKKPPGIGAYPSNIIMMIYILSPFLFKPFFSLFGFKRKNELHLNPLSFSQVVRYKNEGSFFRTIPNYNNFSSRYKKTWGKTFSSSSSFWKKRMVWIIP